MQMGVEWIACHGKNARHPRYFLDSHRYWFFGCTAATMAGAAPGGYRHQEGRIYLLLSLGYLHLSEFESVTACPHMSPLSSCQHRPKLTRLHYREQSQQEVCTQHAAV